VLFQHLFRGKLSVWEQTHPRDFIHNIYLFIYCLFNETFICSEYTAPSITEESNLHIQSCENFKSHITETISEGGSIRSSLVLPDIIFLYNKTASQKFIHGDLHYVPEIIRYLGFQKSHVTCEFLNIYLVQGVI
jgi:hypothetical protein